MLSHPALQQQPQTAHTQLGNLVTGLGASGLPTSAAAAAAADGGAGGENLTGSGTQPLTHENSNNTGGATSDHSRENTSAANVHDLYSDADVCAMPQQLIAPVTVLCLEGQHRQPAAQPAAPTANSAQAGDSVAKPLDAASAGAKSAQAGVSAQAAAAVPLVGQVSTMLSPASATPVDKAAANASQAAKAASVSAPSTDTASVTAQHQAVRADTTAGAEVVLAMWVHPSAIKTAWRILQVAAAARGVSCTSR